MRLLVLSFAAFVVSCSGSKAEIAPPGTADGGSTSGGTPSPRPGSDAGPGTPNPPDPNKPGLSTQPKEGTAGHGATDGSGACGFPATPNDLNVVSLNDPEYAGAAACGACIQVKGAKGEIVARVVDHCRECASGRLDLSESAFALIDELDKGTVPITYKRVTCPVTGNISYHFKEDSSTYWTAIQVRNHAVPIAKLEYKKGAAFVDIKREEYNYFIAESGVGEQPQLVLRVTSADGQVLEDTLPGKIVGNVVVEGSGQFK